MALNPESGIMKQDGRSVVSAVASSSVGNTIAWRWIQDNWDEIRAYFDTSVSSPIARMFESVTQAEDLAEVEAFAAANADNLGTAQRATESDIVDWLSMGNV